MRTTHIILQSDKKKVIFWQNAVCASLYFVFTVGEVFFEHGTGLVYIAYLLYKWDHCKKNLQEQMLVILLVDKFNFTKYFWSLNMFLLTFVIP